MTQFDDRILGKGIVFPFELSNGKVVITSDIELIRKSLITILTWSYGTRFMLGEFGSRLKQLLEDPNDGIMRGLVNHFIIEAISKWETRIELLDPPIITQENNQLYLRLSYKIIKTAQEDSFVFPFYTPTTY